MSTAAEWKARILDVLAQQRTAAPGRAGETPLSNFANELVAIKTSSVDIAPLCRGFSNAIRSLNKQDADSWNDLSYLVQLVDLRDRSVSSALYDKFTRGFPDNSRSRAVILVTLAEMGHRWTPEELRKEDIVRTSSTPEWIDAWIKSGLFEQIKDEISVLLRDNAITGRDLLRRMPAWYQRLGEKLLEILPTWLKVVSKEDQQMLEVWLHRRGLRLLDTSVKATAPSIKITAIRRSVLPLIKADAIEFVRDATTQTAKPLVNGHDTLWSPTNDNSEND